MVALSDFLLLVSSAYNWCCSNSPDQVQHSFSDDFAATIASKTCQELQHSIGHLFVKNASSSGLEYTTGANAAWSVFNTEVNFQPTCIVFVESAEHVQTAMKAIYRNEANYAVQAGGHSGMTGWNTVRDGVLISFANMNASSYNPDRDTVIVEPGARWGEVIAATIPFGVTPVGGRVSDVGTGLLLGGGVSFLSPSEGYASDSYVSLDVVLVDGTLVTATVDNDYADLFKALKGGANRFGIVTRYEMKVVHTGLETDKRWWGGSFVYANSSSEAILEAVAHFPHDMEGTNSASATTIFMTTWQNSTIDVSLTVVMFCIGSEATFNTSFAEFLSIPSTSSMAGPISYFELANTVHFPGGLGTQFSGSVLAGAPANSNSKLVDDYLETYRLYNNFSTTLASVPEVAFTLLTFTPVLKSHIRASYEKGGSPISPPPESAGFNNVLFQVTYQSGATGTTEEVEEGRQAWIANAPNTPGLPLLLNEADAKQHIFATYGGYEFLRRVYAKYDPTGFNIRHTDGPLGLEQALAVPLCEPVSILNYTLPICF